MKWNEQKTRWLIWWKMKIRRIKWDTAKNGETESRNSLVHHGSYDDADMLIRFWPNRYLPHSHHQPSTSYNNRQQISICLWCIFCTLFVSFVIIAHIVAFRYCRYIISKNKLFKRVYDCVCGSVRSKGGSSVQNVLFVMSLSSICSVKCATYTIIQRTYRSIELTESREQSQPKFPAEEQWQWQLKQNVLNQTTKDKEEVNSPFKIDRHIDRIELLILCHLIVAFIKSKIGSTKKHRRIEKCESVGSYDTMAH